MNPGALSHLVRIEHQTSTKSAIGENLETWVTFASGWAGIEHLSGTEGLNLRAAGSEITTRIRMRYIPGVKASMRIVYGTDIYNIVEPPTSPFEKKRELVMLCRRDAD